MTMNTRQFKENVVVYGADVHSWPENVREAGLKALDNSPMLQALLTDEERFERLLKTRKYEKPDSDLAERIILASLQQKRRAQHTFREFFAELFGELGLPRPAFAAVSVSLIFALIIGFAIGFSNPFGYVSTEQYETSLGEFLYYEGEVL
jgi:hypothetical protein